MRRIEVFTADLAIYAIQECFPEDPRLFEKKDFAVELVTTHPPCMKSALGIPFCWRLSIDDNDVYIYEQISKRAYSENFHLPVSKMKEGEVYKDEENDIFYEVVGKKVQIAKKHELCGTKGNAQKLLKEYLIAHNIFSPKNQILAKFWAEKLETMCSGVLDHNIPIWYIPTSKNCAKKGLYVLAVSGEVKAVDTQELREVKQPQIGEAYETGKGVIMFHNGDFHLH